MPIPQATARLFFICPVSAGCGGLANFAWPGGQAFANPGATSKLLTYTWFPIQI